MVIRKGRQTFKTNSAFSFEAHYFRLKLLKSTAIGVSDEGEPLFSLYRGQEFCQPRTLLFSGNVALWTPPTLTQSRALLFQFRYAKDVWVSLQGSAGMPSRLAANGIRKFGQWRFLCDLLGISNEPVLICDFSAFEFAQDVSYVQSARHPSSEATDPSFLDETED